MNSRAHPHNPLIFKPKSSVFVAANAGAGKTSLLVNRVLSLLLHGVLPSKILCLTFTNAAAAEMISRIQRELGKWLMAEEAELTHSLTLLLGFSPSQDMKNFARSLFATVLESSDGIRIQTLHAFCQSLLRRFPIEANLNPHFSVIDDRTEKELLQEARIRLFANAQTMQPELQQSVHALAVNLSEQGFHELLKEVMANKRKFSSIFLSPIRRRVVIDELEECAKHETSSIEALVARHFNYSEKEISTLRHIIPMLLAGGISDKKTGEGLARWLEGTESKHTILQEYLSVFLLDDGELRKTIFTKKTLSEAKHVQALRDEQLRVQKFALARKTVEIKRNTLHVMRLAEALLAIYEALKRNRGAMDYDDLILSANRLLMGERIIPWVLFKLDGGIDHILVDEAQDTSPEQWMIVQTLSQEFFAGKGRSENARSLFIVGDEKQSIYRFQGADVSALGKMQAYFKQKIQDAGMSVCNVTLAHSYRSTREVLQAVDAVFAMAEAKSGLMFEDAPLTHIPTRGDQKGLVELWPLFTASEEESDVSASSRLAQHMANTIQQWLDDATLLDSKNRPVEPGDIMILVRSRGGLVNKLVRALKRRNIPVAGVDRMLLGDNLAIQDLLALGQCLLLPEDDLSLAALLKSPICNISEEALFSLAWNRDGDSLWQRLASAATHDIKLRDAYALLHDLRAKVDFLSPFELYSYALDNCGARQRLIGRMGEEYADPIDEFLHQALLFERSHPASMQGFLHWVTSSDSIIKRDMEQTKNAVRIMTIHGAKGLQAPIVMLPDTTEPPALREKLLWHDQHGYSSPLWSRSKATDDETTKSLREHERHLMLCEYRRLLYVALTRAEDRLYIYGATQKKSLNEQCWFSLIQAGLSPIATRFPTARGEGLRLGTAADNTVKIVHTPSSAATSAMHALPWAFIRQPVLPEPAPTRPLSPSKLQAKTPAAISPLHSSNAFIRGNFIHALLQYLPAITVDKQLATAQRIANSFAETLTALEITQATEEVMRIITNPAFAFLFDKEALAEVPVIGNVTIKGKRITVSGQIDRLRILDDAVWIVDFKSNVLPPKQHNAIPAAYIEQMQLYKALLQEIYPQKSIHTALLWTAGPIITQLDETHRST